MMSTLKPFRLACDSIDYRQGYVEITNIHDRHINVEMWNIDPDDHPLPEWITDSSIADKAVIGNVELELMPNEARALASALLAAAEAAESALVEESRTPNNSETGA